MKTKLLLCIVFFSFQIQGGFSQDVNITLSLTLGSGPDILKKESIVSIPYLNITYRNNDSVPLYFLKLSDNRMGSPILGCSWHFSYHHGVAPSYLKKAKAHLKYTDEVYYVMIGGYPSFSGSWSVFRDIMDFEKEMEEEIINCSLSDIYEYIYRDHEAYDPDESSKFHFMKSDLYPDSILTTYKDKFVFLKPGETHTDTYNLIGFKLVEGNFTFYIHQDRLENYVYTKSVFDKDQSRYIEQTIELPAEVGGYKLYCGTIRSNRITVNFKSDK